MADMTPIEKKNIAAKKKDLNKLLGAINTKAGKNIVNFISDPATREKLTIKYIPFVSLRLNAMCSGLPKGKVSIVSGMPDSGKTSLILETIGKAMKEDPNFVAFWLESEGSLEISSLVEMHGIDPERFIYVELDKDGAAEKALDILEAVIGAGGIDIAVINSMKCLTPKKEISDSMEDQNIGLQARLNSKFMRKIVPLIAEQETALCLTQHLTTQIGVLHGDPMVLAGGQAIRYASMLTLDLRKKTIQASDPISKEEGLKIGAYIAKNHCNQTRYPYLRADYFIKFGEGTQVISEVIELAKEMGILQGSAWISEIDPETGEARVLPNGDVAKWNGMNKTKAYLEANKDYYDYLVNLVMGNKITLETMDEEEVKKAQADNSINTEDAELLDELLAQGEEEVKKKTKAKKKK